MGGGITLIKMGPMHLNVGDEFVRYFTVTHTINCSCQVWSKQFSRSFLFKSQLKNYLPLGNELVSFNQLCLGSGIENFMMVITAAPQTDKYQSMFCHFHLSQ